MRAFETLVQRHQSRVLANCRYLTRSSPDSEDLAQEVFVKAYFGLKGFEGRAQFKTWLQRIKVNHCLNFLRKNEGKTFKNIRSPDWKNRAELRVDEFADRRAENVGARRGSPPCWIPCPTRCGCRCS
jgi:RNA polymerase sigma-70 factor (ECF subfamily)